MAAGVINGLHSWYNVGPLLNTACQNYQRYHFTNSFVFLQICYFFYKNIHFGFTIFYYEGYAAFSGQAAYNDWYMSLFNVFFTSLPVIALGVLEQDVVAQLKLQVNIARSLSFAG